MGFWLPTLGIWTFTHCVSTVLSALSYPILLSKIMIFSEYFPGFEMPYAVKPCSRECEIISTIWGVFLTSFGSSCQLSLSGAHRTKQIKRSLLSCKPPCLNNGPFHNFSHFCLAKLPLYCFISLHIFLFCSLDATGQCG